MKTLAILLGAMCFAATAVAGNIYGGLGADPDLAVWQSSSSHEMTGVQPGIGDAPYAQTRGHDNALFKSSTNQMPNGSPHAKPVDVYGSFSGDPDLQSGF